MSTVDLPKTDGTLNIPELTEGALDGNGIFDVLMRAIEAHINREYKSDRILKADYAQTYIRAIEVALTQSTGYASMKAKQSLELQLLEAEKLLQAAKLSTEIKQGALVDAQTCKTRADTVVSEKQAQLMDEEIALARERIQLTRIEQDIKREELALLRYELDYLKPKELEMRERQIDIAEKDIELKGRQIDVVEYELQTKLPAEVAHLTAQTGLVNQQTTNLTAEALNIPKQGALIEAQTATQNAQTDLVNQQTTNLTAEALNIPKQGELIEAQTSTQNAQTQLYNQKKVTEQAQVDASVIGPNSVIDKQNKLYQAQSDSYLRAAEQNAARILVDTWNTRFVTDPDGNDENAANGLLDSNIGKSITKLLAGIDAL